MALIQVKDISISFNTRDGVTDAVNNASFQLDQGQTLCIVGESGSGKSVLCSSLMGLLPPHTARINTGSISMNGKEITHYTNSEMRKLRGNHISMIFQDPMTSLNPYLTIGTQIIEPLQLHQGKSARDARPIAIKMLGEVGLKDPEILLKRYPHELSGGMRQRVMIAMALVNEPEVLIADEPTTALDVTIQAQILKLLKRLQREYNLAVIFVSHDLGVVSGIADYILVMQEGEIVEEGTPEKIFYQTEHPYTKNLLASIPHTAKPSRYILTNDTRDIPLLSIEKLKTYYLDNRSGLIRSSRNVVKAVDDVSIVINKGETLGLVGESGSGKSTLGRSVMRLVQIEDGRVLLNNEDIALMKPAELKVRRREFQMIFQDPYASLNPRMTIYDTLTEALKLKDDINKDNLLEAVHQIMRDVGLETSQIRKYPHEFSGGQRQRIAIARSIAMKPRLIIADEPVSALDVTIQAQIMELLLSLVRQYELTMLFISHDLSVVRYMSDRIAVMYQGKIVEENDTEALFNNPAHPYTRSLLASVPLPDPKNERAKYARS